ncbi:MAG: hypothetical protein WBR35_11350, partial [Anaerolineae bacterium]
GPGAVEIGAAWNRFGDAAAGNLDEDWPRALAHELGHLLFFLDDNYLGLDEEKGLLKPVSDCSGVMADPYKEDDDKGNGEFHLTGDWKIKCGETLSEKGAGRSDWATIHAFYPWLQEPTTDTAGPDILPFRVTQIASETWPADPVATLASPNFYLLDVAARPVQPGPGARAFLYKQGDKRIVDLGRPQLDQVQARGAQVGDTLCVMDQDANRQGCTTVQERGNQEIVLVALADGWRPQVTVSPVNTTTIAITLTGVPSGLNLVARFVPSEAPLTTSTTNTLAAADGVYTANLPFQGGVGFIDITTGGSKPCLAESCRITLDLTVGGSPAFVKGTGRLAFVKGTGRLAPVLSNDGQAMLFGQDLNLGKDRLMILQTAVTIPSLPPQTAVTIPSLPPWATLIGHAYRLAATSNVILSKTSLSIGYLGNEVPPGEEPFLRIHHWNEKTEAWQPLATTLVMTSNNAVAAIQGSGLYALLSSTEIMLQGAGWHAFGYPVSEPPTRTIADALASLPDGAFTLVYGYTPTLETDPWQVYAPGAPAGFNTLQELRFGQGYFIHTTGDAVLRFKGLSPFAETASGYRTNASSESPALPLPSLLPPLVRSLVSPPALITGTIEPGSNFSPTAGLTLTAWIKGRACGDGSTLVMTNGISYIGYSVMVRAADEDPWSGCGVPGAVITFSLESPALALSAPTPVTWNNSQATAVTLTVATAKQSNPEEPSACANLLRNGDFEQAGDWTLTTT